MCTARYLLIFPRDILLWLIGVLNTLNALFFAMIFVVYYCQNNFKVLMWFFFSLVIEVQNLFVQIIYEFASPCIDVLPSAEWLAPLFQFIFSYLLANNRLFLQWKVLFLSPASLIHGTPGCTKPYYLTIKSNCPHVKCVKLSIFWRKLFC